ncbi:MAG: hypothetical protein ACOCX4_07195 [Planctomycetota bacterium]
MELLERWRAAIEAESDALVRLRDELVAIPSVNRPPHGEEAAAQRFLADRLWSLGMPASLAMVEREAEEVRRHPVFRPDRDLSDRPQLTAVLDGAGGGRNLLLAGHVDTPAPEAPGDAPVVAGGKAGLACIVHALACLEPAGIRLAGTVTVASLVDECGLGGQGALGLAYIGVTAEAALYVAGLAPQVCLEGDAAPPNGEGVAVECWRCSDDGFAEVCRKVAGATGAREAACSPNGCAPFLLSNYGGLPVAVLGDPAEPPPESVPADRDALVAQAGRVAAVLAVWCGEAADA